MTTIDHRYLVISFLFRTFAPKLVSYGKEGNKLQLQFEVKEG